MTLLIPCSEAMDNILGPANYCCKITKDGTWVAWWGEDIPSEKLQEVTDNFRPNGGGFSCPYVVGTFLNGYNDLIKTVDLVRQDNQWYWEILTESVPVWNLGIDFGNVICKEKPISMSRDLDWSNREFLDNAVENIAALVAGFDNVYIVSKCSQASETLIPQWLESQNFFEKTGLNPQNIRFCRKRADKAAICKELKIGCFIDDRVEVLSYMDSVRFRIALNPKDNGKFGFAKPFEIGAIPEILLTQDWKEIAILMCVLLPGRKLKAYSDKRPVW